ncbi:MAG: UDP-N-acetylmuramate dehydrogenase [Clostridia bacterium]|nr:UDP-N-acetylmuramate dehydrogenase [Clostridia bacterium]
MSRHTTFRIGGNADALVTVNTLEQLKTVMRCAKSADVPVFCLGRGSNLLVSDNGIAGITLSLGGMTAISRNGDYVTCEAGASLSSLCLFARDESLAGMEFAYGIPGSVGGALFMNAGAYGGEMSQVVSSARCIDANGEEHTLSAEEMRLGYRTSIFRENGWIVVSVTVKLAQDEHSKISERMEELLGRRKDKQPLEYPSAGSVFKRPQGHFAGALIEQANLKGASVGGASVSEKHAGFIINHGGATAQDVKDLIAQIQKTVLNESGVLLEPEVLSVGRE